MNNVRLFPGVVSPDLTLGEHREFRKANTAQRLNDEVVGTLEGLLDRARRGELTSMVCIATHSSPDIGIVIVHANVDANANAYTLLGGLSRFEHGINVMLEQRVRRIPTNVQAPCDTEPKGE